MKRVGIIGGGAAGLSAARNVLATGTMMPQVWELAPGLGGTWRYNPDTGKDHHGLPIHSSMYQNLKTNLPKEVMGFPDYPFPAGGDSFIHHSSVVKYLQSYSDHFNLNPWIKYQHYVDKVIPVEQDKDDAPGWKVTVKDLSSGEMSTDVYNAIIICNGHYSVPRMPSLPGIEQYKGRQLHSHNYREPSSFAGATVLVLGAGASGIDISLELTTVAKQVFLSHNQAKKIQSELPSNMMQVAGAVAATTDGFQLSDGSSVKADVILYCTGYEYSFPFLSEECGITIENNQVKPLFKHLINAAYPTMAFLGIPFQICPFPMFDFQAKFFMKVQTGELLLPSREEMENSIQQELEERLSEGVPAKHFHHMSELQWRYSEDMAKMAGLSTTHPVIEKLFTAVRELRNKTLLTYKRTRYNITGPDSFEMVQ